MQKCEFCGSLLPEYGSFCGQCGRVTAKSMDTRTIASDFHMPDIQNIDTATIASTSVNIQPNVAHNQHALMNNIPTTSLNKDEEEEEENHRRAALLRMGMRILETLEV